MSQFNADQTFSPNHTESEGSWRENTSDKLQRRISQLKTKVSLNINGRLFTTSKATLTRSALSVFVILLGTDIWDANNGGTTPFFDVSADAFGHILDLLSNGFVRIGVLNLVDGGGNLTSVMEQLKIFRIPFILDEQLGNLQLAESAPLTPALWQDLCDQTGLLARISSQKVLLNFRGTLITANRADLNKSAWFRAQLSSRWAPQAESDGAYFIDRNARFFTPILTYLQTGSYQFDPAILPEIEAELEFFLIARRTECHWDSSLCSANAAIRPENPKRVFKLASAEYGFNAAVIGTEPVTYIKYRAVRCPDRNGILFGLGPRESFHPTAGRAHGDAYGFFIYSNCVVFGRGKRMQTRFPALLSGDEIEFRVNLAAQPQTIEVKTSDCRAFQVAFEGVEMIGKEELYPVIDMEAPGACEVEILETRWSPA